jgi:NAD(P)-dependent dehydrogenase (short-subunit alcohol dehydrogenase family)
MRIIKHLLPALCVTSIVFVACASAQAETVLITGANQGIGLEFTKQYAARGWNVIATHRRSTTPEELAKLSQQYPKLQIERMDVTDAQQIDALAAKLKGTAIDILIHNAGMIRTDALNKPNANANQDFGTLDFKLLDEFVHTNVTGPLEISQAFISNIRASKLKKIVAISSAAAMITLPPSAPGGGNGSDHYWYRITKTALNSAMKLLSVELKDEGIVVVMFHPGGVQVESFGDVKLPGFEPPAIPVGKMVKTIDKLTIKDTGRFLQNDGTDHPW